MSKIHLLFLTSIIATFIYSCSSDSGVDDLPPITNETFLNWTPNFTNQTSNFTQTRTGSKGTKQTRVIEVSSSSNSSQSSEGN